MCWVRVLFVGHETQCPQVYIKLTQFEDNDGRKLPLKILLAEVYNSFLETSKISHNFFVLVR